jgi:hypothetical protein
MRKYTCKQCGLGPMSMKKLRKHKEDAHGVIMGTGRLKKNYIDSLPKHGIEVHEHDHDESVPHTHDFGERVEYLQEGAKSLLKEMEVKKLALEGELGALEQHISFLRKNLTFGVAD